MRTGTTRVRPVVLLAGTAMLATEDSGSTPTWAVVALAGAIMLPVAILYALLVIRSRAGARELEGHEPDPPISGGATPVDAVPVSVAPVVVPAAVPVSVAPVEPISPEPEPEHREYMRPPRDLTPPPQPATVAGVDPSAGWPAEAVWRTPYPVAIPVPPPGPAPSTVSTPVPPAQEAASPTEPANEPNNSQPPEDQSR